MTNEIDRRDRERLLRHLREPNAYGIVSPLGCGRIALYRERNGASLGAGYVAAEAAAALMAEGLIAWAGEGRGAGSLVGCALARKGNRRRILLAAVAHGRRA